MSRIKKFFIVAGILAVFGFFAAPTAKAMTAAELQTMISALQAQIVALQQQLTALQGQGTSATTTPSAPTTTEWCHTFNTNLRIGDGGDGNSLSGIGLEVNSLIKALSQEGLLNYDQVIQPGSMGTSVRGTYFSETIAAGVVKFQEKYASEILAPYGLQNGTGYVGPTTRAKLNKLYGCGVTSVCKFEGETCNFYGGIKCCSGLTCQQTECPAGVNCPNGQCVKQVITTPSITVTSPNGGETYTVGTGYLYIKYTASNISVGTEVTAYLRNPAGNEERTASKTVENNGANTLPMNMELASSETPGQYKIEVCAKVNGTNVCDTGDSYFSIVAASTNPPCSDSDVGKASDGKEYYTKGTVSGGSYGAIGYNHNPFTDYCNAFAPNSLVEYYCVGDYVQYTSYTCPNGCSSGACVQACYRNSDCSSLNCVNGICVPMTCSDTDGGKNYYQKGTVYGRSQTLIDSCINDLGTHVAEGNRLVENFCPTVEDDGGIEIVSCSNGCKDGACVQATTTPSITVISPNGGESWKISDTHEVGWIYSPLPPNDFQIELVSSNGNRWVVRGFGEGSTYYQGSSSQPNNYNLFYINWKVGYNNQGVALGNFPLGQYKIEVSHRDTSNIVTATDLSNNYFSIIAATPTCTDSDGGKNYYTKGKCSSGNEGSGDYCSYSSGRTGTLKEAFCGLSGCEREDYACKTGEICRAGKCAQGSSQDPICVDTDGGNAYLKGETHSMNLTGAEDSCYVSASKDTPAGALGASCASGATGQYCGVYEYYCSNNDYASSKFVECSNGCKDGACVQATATPSITVILPNGGEVWEIGKTYDITWKALGTEKVSIDIAKYDNPSSAWTLASDISASTGKYSWKINAAWPNLVFGNNYKVRVFTYPLPPSGGWIEGKNYDQSDNYFTIVAAPVCTDNDPYQDSLVFGTCKASNTNGGAGGVFSDYCSSDKKSVMQHKCSSNLCVGDVWVSCPSGKICQNGACIPEACNDITNNVQTRMNSSCGDANYKSMYDLNKDGKINVSDSDLIYSHLNDQSWCITTRASTVNPCGISSIKVLSPNGGETWQIGAQKTVTWSSTNFPSSQNITYISLVSSSGKVYQLVGVTPNDGSQTVTVPTSATAGSYKIEIYGIANGSMDVWGKSDNYFSIVAAATTTPASCLSLYNDIIASFGTMCGDANYNAILDVDKDKVIDISDYSIVIYYANQGNAAWCDAAKASTTNPCDCAYLYNGVVAATDAKCGDVKYNYIFDLNKDKTIAWDDLGTVQSNYANEAWCTAAKATTTNPCAVIVGKLNFALSADNPPTSQLTAGAIGVTFTKIKLTADATENILVNQIQVSVNLGNSAPISSIKNISLWDGTTQLGFTAASLSAAGTATFYLSSALPIPANSIKNLTIKADVNSYNNIVSGGTVSLGFSANGVSYRGVTSLQESTGPASAVNGNPMYVYRTTLSASLNASTPSGGAFNTVGQQTISFNVNNNSNNFDASLNSITFKISYIQGTGYANAQADRHFYLYDAADLTTAIAVGTIPIGVAINNYNLIMDLAPDYNISSGATRTFVLVGDLSDLGVQTTASGSTIRFYINSGSDFIWDDNMGSAVSSNYTKSFPINGGVLFTGSAVNNLANVENQLANISASISGLLEQLNRMLGR